MSRAKKIVRKISAALGRNPSYKKRRYAKDAIRSGDPKFYYTGKIPDYQKLAFPGSTATNAATSLKSSLCTRSQLESPAFRFWLKALGEDWRLHRKQWEFAYVMQSLHERGMLREGRKGLGFAVGNEPIPSLMAHLGVEILATDLDAGDERSVAWAETNQLASSLEQLNRLGLCSEDKFRERVQFQPVDMNKIPQNLIGYDFTWSSCSFEHCGSIGLGKRFIREQMLCLKPGGVAVHTTEFNLSSNESTVDEGSTVIFRRQDIEGLVRDLVSDGHSVEPLLLDTGKMPEDKHVDIYPYAASPHLKLELYDKYVSTSVGLIVTKDGLANASRVAA